MLIYIIYLIGPSLFRKLSTFLTYIGLLIFFSLNSYFLANSKLMTSSVAPLSSSASTIIPSYVLILSNLIFTVTFLNLSPLSRLQTDIFSTTLLSIANLFMLEPNQGLLDFLLHLTCVLSVLIYIC